jgi:hypothetical protein
LDLHLLEGEEMNIHTSETEYLKTEVQRLSALVRAQQITIDKLEQALAAPVQEPVDSVQAIGNLMFALTTWKATTSKTAPAAWKKLLQACADMVATEQPAPVQEKWGASAVMNPDYVAAQKQKAQQALDVMAENARELGLDYEPVWNNLPSNKDVENAMRMKRLNQLANPLAAQRRIEELEAELMRMQGRELKLQMSLNTPTAQRQWVGLTDEEIDLFINGRGDEDDDDYVEPTGDGFGLTDADLVELVRRAEAKLKQKNT